MVPPVWSRLNRYGKTVVTSAVLGLAVLVVTGSLRDGLLVFGGIAAATTAVAMYRRSPDDDTGRQPGDRTEESDGTDLREQRVETRKGASDGRFSK